MAFETLKGRQREMWGSGAYEPVVGLTHDIHVTLVGALAPSEDEHWLDVATGTGAVALHAARAGADVTGLDLSPVLVETARRKAQAESLEIDFLDGDAEALPFEDGSFDVVCSALGTQFAPDHAAVASELGRVSRPGGRLGLACWTPDGEVAAMFGVMRPYLPEPPEGAGDTFAWGDMEYARGLLEDAFELTVSSHESVLHAESGEWLWDLFATYYGPLRTLVASLDDERREALRDDVVEFFEQDRVGGEIVQSRAWLLILGTRRG
jgi:SAM-dependent methyltransferase